MTEIGKEYGTALFMLACEENAQNEYAEALERLKAVFLENLGYQDFLSSPSIPLGERLSAIEAAFAGSVPENVLSYLQLLCEKGRISCFLESVGEYKALLDASQRVSNAEVTSAVEITEEEKKRLQEKLEKLCEGKVNIKYEIDPAVLGGLIIEMDGKVIDGSLRNRLREVKEVMNA